MKKIILIIVIIGLIIGCYLIYNNIQKEKLLTKDNMNIIENNYKELTNNVNDYNTIRKELNDKLSLFFYDNYLKEKNKYEEILNKYNDTITKIDSNINNIDTRCNVIYKKIDINKICSSYKTLYEKLINLYVKDLKTYNDKVTGYNDYKKAEEQLFNMIHNNYIDYNKDEIYEGISSNEEVEE